MLNRLPLGSCPARSAAAVTLDDRFVAELTGPLGVGVEVDDPPEEAVEAFVPLLPWREAICALTRLRACWLAMLAKPVV
jgi:hypothetical protein